MGEVSMWSPGGLIRSLGDARVLLFGLAPLIRDSTKVSPAVILDQLAMAWMMEHVALALKDEPWPPE